MSLNVYAAMYTNLQTLTYVQTDVCKAAPKMFLQVISG